MANYSPLFKNDKPHFHTSGGELAVGYGIYTYYAGTNTPVAMFSDPAGTTQYQNPIVLDSRGEPSGQGIYANVGNKYKVILKDPNGATVWSMDDVSPMPEEGGGGGGSGLSEVAHDETMTGNGTPESPLSVVFPSPSTYQAGDGLKLNGNTFSADSVELEPWTYLNYYGTSWSSKINQSGEYYLEAADVSSGIIKIPFDNVQWPFGNQGSRYCLLSLYGIIMFKETSDVSLAGQEWNGKFETATTRSSDRYDYNNDRICDFSFIWDSYGYSTNSKCFGTFVINMNPIINDAFKNIVFDLRDYKQYMAVGDHISINGMIWPLSLKEFNYSE